MIALLTAAIQLAANPFALVGYVALGVYAQRIWQAVKYGLLWGLAVQLFTVALGRTNLFDLPRLATTTGLRLLGAAIITVAVFYLARIVRRR